jgi:hypothetical protein
MWIIVTAVLSPLVLAGLFLLLRQYIITRPGLLIEDEWPSDKR